MANLVFTLTLFCSAFLLFLIQPMVAKTLLPMYGGSPGVWTSCMLFFQLMLWLSYGYSWLISRIQTPYLWRLIHIILFIISFSVIPLLINPLTPGNNPELSIIFTLLKQLGLPLLIIASSAPLIQFAYSQTSGKNAHDPYFLYAASNAGSLLALLLYPFLIERFTNLNTQFWSWNVGYVTYFICLGFCFFAIPYQSRLQVKHSKLDNVSWPAIGQWLMLSFIPCSLMLGVTFYLTSDIAATPLLWIMPLAIYLLSFVLTFNESTWRNPTWIRKYLSLILLLPLLIIFIGPNFFKTWHLILFHLFAFFAIALYCHGRLYQSRPETSQLTLFYFCLASGGLMAGLFNGIIAPELFNDAYEYPLVLILTFALVSIKPKKYDWVCPIIILSILLIDYYARVISGYYQFANYQIFYLVLLGFLFIWKPRHIHAMFSLVILALFALVIPDNGNTVLAQQRNFFGVKKVVKSGDMHILFNHTTVHGFQVTSMQQQDGRQSYYGGVAELIENFHKQYGSLKATIVGLGTGMMSCQFQKPDQLTLIDIDPQVLVMAKNKNYFTFLHDCAVDANLLLGDGRLTMKQLSKHSQDMIILDAFSSDAIPIHLLTLEAVKQYQSAMSSSGLMLIHISNRHINLLPVLTAIGRQLNLIVLHLQHPADLKHYQLSSEWVLLTKNEFFAQSVLHDPYWQFVTTPTGLLWRDNFASIIPVLK